MNPTLRVVGIAAVFLVSTLAWLLLGGITLSRTDRQTDALGGRVTELWGRPQAQAAPRARLLWPEEVDEVRIVEENGHEKRITERVTRWQERPVPAGSTDLEVSLREDVRRKGLVWYPLYDVDLRGAWTFAHAEPRAATLEVAFDFPDPTGVYDGFQLLIDGVDQASKLRPEGGRVVYQGPVEMGQVVKVEVAYHSRGSGSWTFAPVDGVGSLEDFALRLQTDFADIDFPEGTLSPTDKRAEGEGWALAWTFDRVVTGKSFGMVVPHPIQPGELASELSFSAPVSLLFFFLVVYVLGRLRKIEMHPMNYALIAGAFFAFHLLFAYSADRLPVEAAFALASAVSVLLVVSYLRLVVSARFALVEAGLAQLVYLVGFSAAHFWDGLTGLTVTVLAILTLFLVMQLTGRVRWGEPEAAAGGAPALS